MKHLKIKGYSQLRKQEITDKIRTAGSPTTHILDEEVPDMDSHFHRTTRNVKQPQLEI